MSSTRWFRRSTFLECRFRRQHGLQQERPLVELRHEVAADAGAEDDRGCGDQDRDQRHDAWVT
jgi:hypothetical protein